MEDSRPQHDAEREDALKYHYRLETLFDISRDLFGALDAEVILRNLLLSTMGNFGVVNGFVLMFDTGSGSALHFVSKGFPENELPELQAASARLLLDSDPRTDGGGQSPEITQGLPAGLACALPFAVDAAQIGLIALGPKILGGAYAEDEKKLLATLRNSLVIALRNAGSFAEINRLNADLLDKKARLEDTVQELEAAMIKVADYSRHLEKIIAALNVAQEVQQGLLPRHPPNAEHFDIAGASLYCDETGGDYFDYIALPGQGRGACALVAGDVSGHGISSALLMAGVRAYLRGRAARPGTAAEIVTDVNRLVAADTEQTFQFMTLFFLVVDAANHRLTWVNAGHEPALVYDPGSGRFEELKGGGLPLGVEGGWRYTEHSAAAAPGQIVVLTTDGVFEAHNRDNELFGKERVREIVRAAAGLNAEGILKAIVDGVAAFRGGAAQNDDITLVVAKSLEA